ncbi:histidine phosphatase family protein [Thalassolituus sp. LLYu03]|uniref:histidine phosphatase family protein n=1 Tax=Thalassolituus sp. LLYu03 TaxID=3421656 RepID=UPI003D2B905F
MTTTRIDLIRHGEPEGGDVFRGRINPVLTAQGIWQFERRLELIERPWSRVISSPLSRCLQSAQSLSERLALPLEVDERWIEIDFGDWENRPVADVLREQSAQAKQLWADPLNFCAPGGEPVPALQQRVVAAWTDLLNTYQGEHLLVVCHGGVMRVLAQHLLSLAPDAMNRLSIPYAGLLRFKVDRSEWMGKSDDWVSLEGMDGSELTLMSDC